MPCTATSSPARRSGMAHRVEHGNAGAEQRRGFVRRKIVGHGRNRLGRDHHVFRVAAVEADSGNFLELAKNEMAATAGVALEAVSAMPAHAHTLAGFPLRDVSPNRVDASGDLMARNARILQSGKARLFYDNVAVADAAGLNLDPYLGAAGFRNRALHHFEVSTWFADLYGFHIFVLRNAGVEMSLGAGFSGYRIYRWRSRRRRCRNRSFDGCPVLVSPVLERQGGEVGMRPVAPPHERGRSRLHCLLVSLRDELADRLIGFCQRRLVGQEHDAEVAGAGLLAKAGAVDHQHVFLRGTVPSRRRRRPP